MAKYLIDELRVGNIVQYKTRESELMRVVKIAQVPADFSDFSFQRLQGGNTPVIGHDKYIERLYLETQHLKQLGFIEDNGTYRFGWLRLIRAKYIEPNPAGGMLMGDLGFRIIDSAPKRPMSKIEFEALHDVSALHLFQNYCSDHNIEGIDFSRVSL